MFCLCISQIMTSMSKHIEFVVSLKIKDLLFIPSFHDLKDLLQESSLFTVTL